MKFRFRSLLVMSLIVSVPAFAEEYKDPATFTQEEHQMVYDAKNDYLLCLQNESFKIIQQNNDPRHIADAAMKSCASILEKLYTQITNANYSPDVARKFTWSISNRGAKKLLSNLMQAMAMRNVQATSEASQTTTTEEQP